MPPLSLAQTLPPELLTRIFGWLIKSEIDDESVHYRGGGLLMMPASSLSYYLRDTALVCRAWRAPSQRMLFRFIDFSCSDTDKLAAVVTQKPNLAAVVTQKPNLAAEVHAVCAGLVSEMGSDNFPNSESRQYKSEGETACRILAACGNIKHVDLRGFMRALHMRLLGILDSLDLESLMAGLKPSLRILDLRLWIDLAKYGTTLPPRSVSPASHVTTLSLTMPHPTFALRILHEVSNTLVTLEIYQLCSFADERATSVLVTLRKLELIVLESPYEKSQERLAPALPHLPALRRLACDFDLGAIVLQSPSPNLRHLACSSVSFRFPQASLRAMVYAASAQSGRLQFETVSVGRPRDAQGHVVEMMLQELRAALEDRGVQFRIQSPLDNECEPERYLWFT